MGREATDSTAHGEDRFHILEGMDPGAPCKGVPGEGSMHWGERRTGLSMVRKEMDHRTHPVESYDQVFSSRGRPPVPPR